jgi:hypothetical protein
MTGVVEMKNLNVSPEQVTINILGESLDKINESLRQGKLAYEFMQKQTSKAKGTVNKKSHEEDLKKFKDGIDDLEKVKKEIQEEIKKIKTEISSKKGGRRTRKKRGKRTRRRKRKRKKRRTRRAGTLKQSKVPGKRGLTDREIELRSKRRRDKIEKVSNNIRSKFGDRFSNLSISHDRSPSPPGFDSFMKTHITPPSTPPSGGKKTRKKRRRKRRR